MAQAAMGVTQRRTGTALWAAARLFRLLSIGALAGLGAGFVAGGIGSRLAMKAVALIAGSTA